MTTQSPAGSAKGGISTVFLLLAMVVFGFFAGGLVRTRILQTRGGMGWDEIATALEGVVFGVLAGLAIGLVLVWRLAPRARVIAAVLALAGAAAAYAYVSVTPPNIRSGPRAPPPPLAVERFSVTLATADPWNGPRRDDAMLPWNTLSTDASLILSYVLHAAPDRLCIAPEALANTPGIETARALRVLLEQLPAELDCEAPCPACTEISLEWFLDSERRVLNFDDRCWREDATLLPLRESLESIYAGHDRRNTLCETLVR